MNWQNVFKNLDFTQREVDRFLMIFGGHIFFQTLYAGVQFDLFTILDNKKRLTLEGIVKELGIERQPARILLLGLTSIDLLKKNGDYYSNSRTANYTLSRNSDRNIIRFIELEHHVMYRGMFHFFDSLKQNRNVGLQEFAGDEPTLYERLAHEPEVKQIFQDALHEMSVHANEDLVSKVDFSGIKYLVDIGGGDGTNIMRIAEEFAHVNGAVFDLPTMCPIATENIKKRGLAERIDVIPGNCFENDFPEGADCFLFSHFMTIWSEDKDKLLFQKAYNALNPGGKVMIFNQMQHDDGTGPLFASIGSPYFLAIATGEGMLYSWKEYQEWMAAAGFKNIKTYTLPRAHGVIVGEKL